MISIKIMNLVLVSCFSTIKQRHKKEFYRFGHYYLNYDRIVISL